MPRLALAEDRDGPIRPIELHERWKLLIDERHQRRGYGAAAVSQVAEIVRNEGAPELLTSYVIGDGEPWPFHERLGFLPTGELDAEGKVILRLDLASKALNEAVDRG